MTAKNSISINGRPIGQDHHPYIIAEISANHNGSIETAFELIRQAKESRADAVKMQTYRPDTITLDCDTEEFRIRGGLWDGHTLYELYEWAHTPWEWHKPLFEYAKKIGITIFSSPFDNTAVDLLESLNAPAYKIASFEAIDLPLIDYVARIGKPMIISTGMASLEEIEEAIDTARSGGCQSLAILHCVSAYPAAPQDYCLKTIPSLIEKFELVTGLSDHTLSNTTALTSVALGASIVEKHFTLNRDAEGPDNSFSLEPKELQSLTNEASVVWQAIGQVNYGLKSSETDNVKYRRSLYYVKDAEKGEKITTSHIKSVRPGYGVAPKNFKTLIGKKLTRTIKKNTPVLEGDWE